MRHGSRARRVNAASMRGVGRAVRSARFELLLPIRPAAAVASSLLHRAALSSFVCAPFVCVSLRGGRTSEEEVLDHVGLGAGRGLGGRSGGGSSHGGAVREVGGGATHTQSEQRKAQRPATQNLSGGRNRQMEGKERRGRNTRSRQRVKDRAEHWGAIDTLLQIKPHAISIWSQQAEAPKIARWNAKSGTRGG